MRKGWVSTKREIEWRVRKQKESKFYLPLFCLLWNVGRRGTHNINDINTPRGHQDAWCSFVCEGRSKTSLCCEGWCFAGRWGGGGAELPWEFCKPPPWHHRLQTPSTPHHILSTCNLWPCLFLIVEWGCAHKQSPPAQARLDSLGFFISAPVRTQEALLPQSWNICLRKEGISSFQGLCYACAQW